MSHDPERTDASQISTDHESIRAWANEEGATPFRDREEMAYRLSRDEPAGDTHERVDWEEFHRHLDENDRVVIYRGDAADEPFEVVSREDAISRSNVDDADLEDRLLAGDTVTSTVTETTVVEEVVVEEATVESELRGTDVVDESVVDVELLSRECTRCDLVDTDTLDAEAWFDEERYLSSMRGADTVDRAGTTDAGTMGEPSGTTGTTSTETTGTDTTQMTGTGPETTETTTSTETDEDEEDTHPATGTTTAEPSTSDAVTTEARTEREHDVESATADRGPDTREGDRPSDEGDFVTGTIDRDREYTDVDGPYPYDATLEVEEAWSVTREVTERHTIESRVADVDVEEHDAIEDVEVDVEGLQRNLASSDLVDLDVTAEQLREEDAIETEFEEDDRILTHVTRTQIVEDEVVDRQHLRAEVTGAAEPADFQRVSSMDLAAETTEGETAAGETPGVTDATTADATATDESTAGDEEVMDDSAAMGTASGTEVETGSDDVPLSQDEVGKDVVDADGERIGMVSEVSDDGRTMYVDTHPGITDRIKAALDWGGADEDDAPIEIAQIDRVTRDSITLKAAEDLEEMDSPTP